MAQQLEIPFKPTNQIWRTYKHFPYKAWYAVGELVDNSTQSYFEHKAAIDAALAKHGTGFEVRINYDPKGRVLSIYDNAMGMDLEELKRAVQLASPPPNTSGRSEFGMGLKTACSWLGERWSVHTKKLGEPNEYSFSIDIAAHAASMDEKLVVLAKPVSDKTEHYTRVTIEGVRGDLQRPRTLGKVKQFLADMYRKDIQDGTFKLIWDSKELEPSKVEVLKTSFNTEGEDGNVTTETREWKKDFAFDVVVNEATKATEKVYGFVCLVANGGRSRAGFDLVRRGRVIIGRPSGYRPERIFGEARNDLINQRLYGEIHLDNFSVNHLKDDFLWDSWGEGFEEQLETVCADYVKQAREMRTKKKVPPAVVQATNDEIADALSDEDAANAITILEQIGPTPVASSEEQQAEAEALRNQPIDPRIVEIQGKVYRIFHPQGMHPDQPYVRYEAPSATKVDIFINDNHPHIGQLGDGEGAAEKYQMYALNCVVDAIAAHLIAGLNKPVEPHVVLQYKDRLLRVLIA